MTKNIDPAAAASASYSESNPARGHTRGVNHRQRLWTAVTLATLSFGIAAPAFAQAPVGRPQLPPRAQPQPVRRAIPPLPAAHTAPIAPPPAALPAPRQAEPPAAPAAPKGPSAEEKALRGIVVIERAGQPIALGAALAGDGRVLTALSPLGSGNDIDVRFADGKVVRAKLGHHDRVWDLAFLVPQSGRWTEGLVASTKDPVRQDATIRSFSAVRGKLAPTQMVIRGRRTLLGADDATLPNAFELGARVSPLDLGAPIIDEDGRVVAMLARGCMPNEGRPCTPVAFGVPITAVRSFLKSVPATAVAPSAWLGIQGVAEIGSVAKGVRIESVLPDSPAAEAKLLAGDASVSDMIVAVDGVPVTSPETLAEAIRTHAVGEKVPLLVFGQGKYRQVTVLLRQAPDPRATPTTPPVQAELPTLGEPAPGTPGRPRTDLMERRR